MTAAAALLYEDGVDAILLLLECGGMFGVMLWVARGKATTGLLAWRERGPGRGPIPAPTAAPRRARGATAGRRRTRQARV